ncbi:4406_t:CDS:2, partial [Funneliformis caledonium]
VYEKPEEFICIIHEKVSRLVSNINYVSSPAILTSLAYQQLDSSEEDNGLDSDAFQPGKKILPREIGTRLSWAAPSKARPVALKSIKNSQDITSEYINELRTHYRCISATPSYSGEMRRVF